MYPILRIETGMYTAPIIRIGVDADNRFIVTGSHEKSVRIWDIYTGSLTKILRPPIGEENEGKIYAVAISPDGRTIACGGWTKAAESFHNIYLFDRESGQLIRRIMGLPNVVLHLRYSQDGRYLIATSSGRNSIRIYNAPDYSLIKEDKEYGSDCYGADFDRTNRLVTTSAGLSEITIE